MQFSFSDASAVSVGEPTASMRNEKVTAAAHKQSLHAIADQVRLDHLPRSEKDQHALSEMPPAPSEMPPAEPLKVVKQTIDDLEAQGLLMLFDRHDQVAKRLTDDLISAGVLQENLLNQENLLTE
jgi:hypothetical protein